MAVRWITRVRYRQWSRLRASILDVWWHLSVGAHPVLWNLTRTIIHRECWSSVSRDIQHCSFVRFQYKNDSLTCLLLVLKTKKRTACEREWKQFQTRDVFYAKHLSLQLRDVSERFALLDLGWLDVLHMPGCNTGKEHTSASSLLS